MPKQIDHITAPEIAHLLADAQKTSPGPVYSENPYFPEYAPTDPRPAAVLIPLLRSNNAWHLLFTRRTNNLPEHRGQVAFPGGRSEPEDLNPVQTALREAQEEIGLKPEDVQILGQLNTFVTITNYLVTPVIGLIPWPYPLLLEKEEVSRAFTIPLDWLADSANYEEKQRNLPGSLWHASVIFFHPYDSETLWGASARFTLALIRTLLPSCHAR